jgi:hypothetical protein
MKSLVLLAHPDDELFILPLLLRESDLTVIFLTNTARFQHSAQFLALKFPKVQCLQVKDLLFTDGKIYQEFGETSLQFLVNLIEHEGYDRLIAQNFENSHQDHDAVAAICHRIQQEARLEILFTNFYTFSSRRRWSFRIRENTDISRSVPNDQWPAGRVELIWLCIQGFIVYRKQWRIWIHIGLALLWSYILRPRFYAANIPSKNKSFGQRWAYFTSHGEDVIKDFVIKLDNYSVS